MPFPFSIPYPLETRPSAWGPSTSNVNFCEADHQFSSHIAELINTLSNLIYLIYAYRGLQSLYYRNRLTFITALPYIGLVAVGLGSAAYHATRLKGSQLADEIGMAVPTGAVMSQLLSFQIRDPAKRKLVYGACLSTVAAVYVVHCFTFSNWLHYPVFGAMVLVVGRMCARLIRGIENPTVRRKVKQQSSQGRVLFVGAFAIWLVDRLCCDALTSARQYLGLPWGWLLELHGWWHIGTGMGAFVFIQVAEYLMEDALTGAKKEDPGDRLSPWKMNLWGSDNDMVPIGKVANGRVSRNAHANGYVKDKKK